MSEPQIIKIAPWVFLTICVTGLLTFAFVCVCTLYREELQESNPGLLGFAENAGAIWVLFAIFLPCINGGSKAISSKLRVPENPK